MTRNNQRQKGALPLIQGKRNKPKSLF